MNNTSFTRSLRYLCGNYTPPRAHPLLRTVLITSCIGLHSHSSCLQLAPINEHPTWCRVRVYDGRNEQRDDKNVHTCNFSIMSFCTVLQYQWKTLIAMVMMVQPNSCVLPRVLKHHLTLCTDIISLPGVQVCTIQLTSTPTWTRQTSLFLCLLFSLLPSLSTPPFPPPSPPPFCPFPSPVLCCCLSGTVRLDRSCIAFLSSAICCLTWCRAYTGKEESPSSMW